MEEVLRVNYQGTRVLWKKPKEEGSPGIKKKKYLQKLLVELYEGRKNPQARQVWELKFAKTQKKKNLV